MYVRGIFIMVCEVWKMNGNKFLIYTFSYNIYSINMRQIP